MTGTVFNGSDILTRDLRDTLRLREFQSDSCAQAIAETARLEGEAPEDARHLPAHDALPPIHARPEGPHEHGRWPGGVPFCAPHLVDYVFNISWRMKSFDGREKSVLRVAVREILPASILDRAKSPYPSTQDPAYERGLRAKEATLLDDATHPAGDLFDRKVIRRLLDRPFAEQRSLHYQRADLERVLSGRELDPRIRGAVDC